MKLFGRAIFVGVSSNNNESTPTKGKFHIKRYDHNWFADHHISFNHDNEFTIHMRSNSFLGHETGI